MKIIIKGRVAEVAASATGIVDRVKQLEGGVEQSRYFVIIIIIIISIIINIISISTSIRISISIIMILNQGTTN